MGTSRTKRRARFGRARLRDGRQAAPSGGRQGREDQTEQACIITGTATTIRASAVTRKLIRWGLWMGRVYMGMRGGIRIGMWIGMGAHSRILTIQSFAKLLEKPCGFIARAGPTRFFRRRSAIVVTTASLFRIKLGSVAIASSIKLF